MLKVIIADDEQHISKLLESLIDWEKLGFRIVGKARDGYGALKLCSELEPDFLITDIRMPGLSGMDLIRELHRMNPQIKVIIITGYSQFQYAHQALRYGVVDYLLKPIRREELIRALEAGREQGQLKSTFQRAEESDFVPRSMQNIKGNLLADILKDRELLKAFSKKDRLPEEYHLRFSGNSWQLLQIEVVLNSEENTISVHEYLEKKLREILNEEFRNEELELIIAADGGSIYCLLNGSREALLNVKDHLQPIKNSLLVVNELFKKIIFTVGVSTVCDSFDRIDSCLDECAEAVRYKIIAGKNQVIRFSGIPANKYDPDYFTNAEFRKEYLYAIAEGEEEPVKEILAELVSAVYKQLDTLDGTVIREIYRNVVTLFFTGAQVLGLEEDENTSHEKLIGRFEYFYSITAAFNYLSDTFMNLLRRCREEQESRSTKPVRVAQLYIEEHYMEPLTLEEIAQEIGFNDSYLSSIFKKQVGKSVIDYLTNVRIQHAKELLIDPERSVEDISDEVGFSDPKYFTRRFKKYTGVSPREYRNLFA